MRRHSLLFLIKLSRKRLNRGQQWSPGSGSGLTGCPRHGPSSETTHAITRVLDYALSTNFRESSFEIGNQLQVNCDTRVGRDSSVVIATGYGLNGRGSTAGSGARVSRQALRPTLPSIHSPPSSDEVMNGGAVPPFPHVFMA
jgi:hypothetical protein